MGEEFEVDPERVLAVSATMRESVTPLDTAAGEVPDADAGLMTPVIEQAVLGLMEAVGLFALALGDAASATEAAALRYRTADLQSQMDLARLLMPGASDAEIRRMAETAERREQIDLADLLLPGGRGEAEEAVLDSPSVWDEAQARQDAEPNGLRDLLLGPLEADGGSGQGGGPGAD